MASVVEASTLNESISTFRALQLEKINFGQMNYSNPLTTPYLSCNLTIHFIDDLTNLFKTF